MIFERLEKAKVIKREKRFRLYVDYQGKELLTYLPNSGRLQDIVYPSATVYVKRREDKKRKTLYEAVLGVQNGVLVSLNASLANKIFEENLFRFPVKVKELKREFNYHGKRYDFLINSKILVEVKSVTLVKNGVGMFPDAPTKRGSEHLEFMKDWIFEKWVIFVIQREDVRLFKPNKDLDERFYQATQVLKRSGGVFFAFTCYVSEFGIDFKEFVDVQI
ncbi:MULTISPECIES: DNA/RNA nuclease SfsA [Dictyoglomus]|jgi:sugar fermentation stimulation protein A|uniref:Sugar fermentation stimulation protein n=1 Tax=Dictyoglomus turgidum (strain DSM 6724 / Z-1310) TaxID=515635 RepID=B8E1K7_DICTD|nr:MULTISPECIES: DNA/RNA nuclease SfsA [Dictyoglomus]ACK41532.1 sugar fermentation stimulation protein [Dictyoglomus turgidum DSM 6724]PNV79403.1 MAG: DNA/RNA nuclease SfsA [Dictyoglomus turgidum]HBU31923.1 DNA/RNA nuclease SfsA [Dictyoglomus sp.]